MSGQTRSENPASRNKILIIRGGAIGDFILTIPAIQLLRSGLPQAHLEILGYPAVTRLAEAAGIADSVRSIEYSGLANFFNPSTILDPELMDYFARFSLVISYLFDPDGFFQGNLERSGVKSYIACSHRIDEAGDHAAAQLARPLEQIALFLEDPAPRLTFPDSIQSEAGAVIAAIRPRAAPIALHPGSGSSKKNWGIDRWIEVADWLHESDPDRPLVLVSGEADDGNAQPLLREWQEKNVPYYHAHSLDLAKLGAILSRCALYLGHDSGISHLAAAAGAPCLLLFGPTDPRIWAPKNSRVSVIEAASGDLSGITAAEVEARIASSLS